MRKTIGGLLWVVFAVMLCGVIGGGLALTFVPALQKPLEPYVCRDGETLTSYSYTCTDEDGTGTCVDMVCVNAQGQRRDVSGYFIAGMFIFIIPIILVAVVAGSLSSSSTSSGQVVMMPQAIPTSMHGMAGNPALSGQALTIQGRDGPFVVQFDDDSLALDEKIAILEKAHDAGQLTDQQLGEAIDEVTRIAEWGE